MEIKSYWTWEQQEKPEREAFEARYHKITERAEKGEVDIAEAYFFHKKERFSYKYPSVLQTVTKKDEMWKSSLYRAVTARIIKRTELSHVAILCGGMKHYEFFKNLYQFALKTEFPKTWEAEEIKERESTKKAAELGKKRLGL